MERGKLKHKAYIEMPIKTSDGVGGFTETWGLAETRMASIWKRRSGEHVVDGKITHSAMWDVRISYVKDLKTGYRLNVNNIHLEILSVMPVDFGKRYIDMVCRTLE